MGAPASPAREASDPPSGGQPDRPPRPPTRHATCSGFGAKCVVVGDPAWIEQMPSGSGSSSRAQVLQLAALLRSRPPPACTTCTCALGLRRLHMRPWPAPPAHAPLACGACTALGPPPSARAPLAHCLWASSCTRTQVAARSPCLWSLGGCCSEARLYLGFPVSGPGFPRPSGSLVLSQALGTPVPSNGTWMLPIFSHTGLQMQAFLWCSVREISSKPSRKGNLAFG